MSDITLGKGTKIKCFVNRLPDVLFYSSSCLCSKRSKEASRCSGLCPCPVTGGRYPLGHLHSASSWKSPECKSGRGPGVPHLEMVSELIRNVWMLQRDLPLLRVAWFLWGHLAQAWQLEVVLFNSCLLTGTAPLFCLQKLKIKMVLNVFWGPLKRCSPNFFEVALPCPK